MINQNNLEVTYLEGGAEAYHAHTAKHLEVRRCECQWCMV